MHTATLSLNDEGDMVSYAEHKQSCLQIIC
jgi:hypothetical protein